MSERPVPFTRAIRIRINLSCGEWFEASTLCLTRRYHSLHSSLELMVLKWNVNLAKLDWAWLHVLEFACKGCAVVGVCGERCPSVDVDLNAWLRDQCLFWLCFKYNEHLSMFQSNTWHVATPKGILGGSVVFNFPITYPITAMCMCNSVRVCGCDGISLGPCVAFWGHFKYVWIEVFEAVSECESKQD